MTDFDQSAIQQRVKRNAGQALFPAVLVLAIGWWLFKPSDAPQSPPEYALIIMIWCLRIGGALLMLAAVVCWTGRLVGMLLDATISTCMTAVFATTGVILLPLLKQKDYLPVLFAFVFALVYGRAARTLWKDYRELASHEAAAADSSGSEQPRP